MNELNRPIVPQGLAENIHRWLVNYIYYCTLTYVFSLRFIGATGIGIKVIELNLILLCLVTRVTRFPRWLLWFLLYITVSFIFGVSTGQASFTWTFDEYRGIVVNLIYFYLFFRLIRNDSDRAFRTYTRFAFWFAVFAIPMWIFSIGARTVRLQGLATEPAQFCLLVLPAYYWYASRFLATRKHLFETAILTLTVAASSSLLGYVCTACGIVMLLARRRLYLIGAPIAIVSLLGIAYIYSPFVRQRAQSLLLVASTSDLAGAELSTYSFASNAVVTWQVLKVSPLIGNGLGSHPVSHARFLDSIPGAEFFTSQGLGSLNAYEAGSLTFRVLSEFGILGYLGVLFFVFHFHVSGVGPRAAISNGILLAFLLKFIRSGEYYQPEQFFFIFIYMLNYRMVIAQSEVSQWLRQSQIPLHDQSTANPMARPRHSHFHS